MAHKVVDQVMERVEIAKEDSDFNCFFSLLLAGEAVFKTITLGIIAALDFDKDRNRYRLEHTLVRADGLGEWGRALEDALSGPASQFLISEAYADQTELNKISEAGTWQHDAVTSLKAALTILGIEAEEVPLKTDLRRWFRLFVTLRNKTRGHGATSSNKASLAISELEKSLELIRSNLSLLSRPWADLYRNYSGKYKVTPISTDVDAFEPLRKEANHVFKNGIYIYFGAFRRVPLIAAGPDLRDFFFANGGVTPKRFEMLSYLSDDKMDGDITDYVIPPGSLPASETEGHGELLVRGN
jgi:hypothetical protein